MTVLRQRRTVANDTAARLCPRCPNLPTARLRSLLRYRVLPDRKSSLAVVPAPASFPHPRHSHHCLRHSRTYPRHSREGGNPPSRPAHLAPTNVPLPRLFRPPKCLLPRLIRPMPLVLTLIADTKQPLAMIAKAARPLVNPRIAVHLILIHPITRRCGCSRRLRTMHRRPGLRRRLVPFTLGEVPKHPLSFLMLLHSRQE